MPKPEIEEFARVLIREVRDRAIESCDMQVKPDVNTPIARRWREKMKERDSMNLARSIIPDSVDETIFYLLQAIDSGVLRITFVAGNGQVVDLSEEGMGELAGWYMGSGGWRSEYSSERFIDDFEDLRDFEGPDVE